MININSDISSTTQNQQASPWKILIVDDDQAYHDITIMVLRDIDFYGRELSFLSAFNTEDAEKILRDNSDLALIILDMVMETENAGLRLIQLIRDELGNRCLQILLRTGQPGFAPEKDIIIKYEINDYKLKSEITSQKLRTSVIASLRAFRLASDISSMNMKLENELAERRAAQAALLKSEQKYRRLIEGSNEIIFSLDKNFNFKLANKAIGRYLVYSSEEVVSKNFLDIIYDSSEKSAISKQIIKSKLEQFAADKASVNFRAELKSRLKSEPKEMQIKMEYIDRDDEGEIIGMAFDIVEDKLLESLISEEQSFIIGNHLITTDDISHRVTRNLSKYMPVQDVSLIRLGLRELIINAIEHGNLNISFSEKSESLMEEGGYMRLLADRQKNPECARKKITIKYSLYPESVKYAVSDEGKGFNYKEILEEVTSNPDKNYMSHGRGIIMAMSIFDSVEFNDKGNCVSLEKKFSPHP